MLFGYIKKEFSRIIYNFYYSVWTLKLLEYFFGLHGYGITLKDRIDFYEDCLILQSFRLRVKIWIIWVKNIYSVMAFCTWIPINLLLRSVYLVFFCMHLIYWPYKLVRYIWSRGYADLKPQTTEPSFINTWYVLFIYTVTWKRSHLHSYNIMYVLLRRYKTDSAKTNPFRMVIKLPFIVGWYILRLLTSIPRSVILDSYEWSKRFKSRSDVSRWKSLISDGILFILVLDEIKPFYYKRIYYTDNNLWNFNPSENISIFKLNRKMGLINPKVMLMRATGCVPALDLGIKPLLLAKKCTIDSLSPHIAHHMITVKLGEKNGIPIWAAHSLSTKGNTPPHYTRTDTGILLPSGPKIQYSSNMIIPGDNLNEVTYKVNPNYPYLEMFRNELGRLGTIFSLMSDPTIHYVPNTKLVRYEPHIINYDYKKYCIGRSIEMEHDLDLMLKETIHKPRNLFLWDSMNWEERLQFQAVTIVDRYPYLEDKIWSIHRNNNNDSGNFDDFDDFDNFI